MSHFSPIRHDRSADECLHHMPTVAHMATNEWARGFAQSILKQSRRRNWRPSEKQLGMMRRMVSELFTAADEEDDFPLIERDDL